MKKSDKYIWLGGCLVIAGGLATEHNLWLAIVLILAGAYFFIGKGLKVFLERQ